MRVAGFAFGLLTIVFLLHVVLWQVRLPRSHTRSLLILFLTAFPVALVFNRLAPETWPLRITGVWEHVQVCLFHISMSLAYIEFYTSIEGDSPTLTMLMFVEQAGEQGRSEEELYALIDDHFVVGSRLESMVESGVAEKDGELYRLTRSGRAWARFFRAARWLYRLRLGG